jgi:type I restriction enzyme M protein
LEDDLLEAVIGLPGALFYGTGIPAVLMIINKDKIKERKNKLIFINSELEYQEGKNQNKLREVDINHIVEVFENFSDTKRYSKVVDINEIRENDYNLNIRRYADTTPPPEQYDFKGILKGGIPISEVEDEYIQETLKGMDVSCIFVKRDKDYYSFKNEIKSREQIRDNLENKEETIIKLFEKWWDKYQIPLKDMDSKVKKSEEIMWKNLKELGYDDNS